MHSHIVLMRFLGQFHYGLIHWDQDCYHGGLITEPVAEINPSGVVVEDGCRGLNRKEISKGLR